MFENLKALKDAEIWNDTFKYSYINFTRLRKNILSAIALKGKINKIK